MADSDCSVVFVPHPTGKFCGRFIDMTGHVNGRLTVIGFAGRRGHQSYWYCRCECGTVKEIASQSLKNTTSQSCGCLRKEITSARFRLHGHSTVDRGGITSEFSAYLHAKQRCEDANCKCYFRYGGRGIRFCFASFSEFLDTVGYKSDKSQSIERIDVNGHYEPGNVRWATPKEQANNTSKTLWITIDGVTKNLPQWLGYGSKRYYSARYQIRSLGRDPVSVVKNILEDTSLQTQPK
jgi:hypothetical protein